MDALSAAAAPATGKRRKRSASERLRIVEETLAPGASVARVARSHGINANQVFGWRKLYQDGKLVDRRTNAVSPAVPRLLPVSVTEAPASAQIATDVVKPSTPSPDTSQDHSGVIHVQLPKAQLRAIGGNVTDRATLVAAILHDTVEDTETTFEELCGQFGEDVSSLVREVTDDKSLDKAMRKQLQIEHAARSSDKAKQIKLADKICNIRDIMSSPPADWTLERRNEYLDWSCKVVSGCRGVNVKLEQLFDHTIEQARKSLR